MHRFLIALLLVAVGCALSAPAGLAADEDIIVVFEQHAPQGEHVGDVDVAAMRVSSAGKLVWAEGQRAVDIASSEALESNPRAIPDGVGGAIVVFEVETRAGDNAGDTEIGAQRTDAKGNLMWNEGAKPALIAASKWAETNPVIVSDGQGGAIVFFEEHARDEKHAGDIDIGAQRLSPSGQLMWKNGESSVSIASAEDIEQAPYAISDGLGGAIVVFEVEPRTGEHAGDTEIAGQRIGGNGELEWESSSGYTLIAFSEWAEKKPVAVPDGQGGAIVVFEQHARGGEHAGDVDVGAQRVSATGQLLWENEGESSAVVSSSVRLERTIAALPSGSGGVLVAFEMESRTGDSIGDADIGGQLISSAGKALWNEGGESVLLTASKWSEKKPVLVGR